MPVLLFDHMRDEVTLLGRASLRLLAGVGRVGDTLVELGAAAVHARRGLTDGELAQIPGRWHRVPATDRGGRLVDLPPEQWPEIWRGYEEETTCRPTTTAI
jgi:hypothetical protein